MLDAMTQRSHALDPNLVRDRLPGNDRLFDRRITDRMHAHLKACVLCLHEVIEEVVIAPIGDPNRWGPGRRRGRVRLGEPGGVRTESSVEEIVPADPRESHPL